MMGRKTQAALKVAAILILVIWVWAPAQAGQKEIRTVTLMPEFPEQLEIRDWAEVAKIYDDLIFDFSAEGPYLPLIRWDRSQPNVAVDSFFLPSYVGDLRQNIGSQEAITTLGAIVGASLVGINKSDQGGQNWVFTQKQFFNHGTGQERVLNYTQVFQSTPSLSWYEVFPAMLFFMLVDQYPEVATVKTELSDGSGLISLEEIMYSSALYYLQRLDDWKWENLNQEPDTLGAIAWLFYMAYQKFGDVQFLTAALGCLEELMSLERNPFYEVLLPYGTFLAGRVSAEQNTHFDYEKLVEWCFGTSAVRKGWGVITETWGDYEVHGLQGSLTDDGGYVFAMNTFQMGAALAPLARYDSRYAQAIGKWLLNLANNARLFYPEYLPLDQQSSSEWVEESKNVVAYEGLRKESLGKTPYATGDAVASGWAWTDFALYGASHVGFLGALVEKTDQIGILKIDLLATDYFSPPAYPSYLLYNPFPDQRDVSIELGNAKVNVYDGVSKRFLLLEEQGISSLPIPGTTPCVVVLLPADGEIEYLENRMLVDGVVVDYQVSNLVIAEPKSWQPVSGKASLLLDLVLAPRFVPKDVRARINGEPVVLAETAFGWEFDTSRYTNGEYELSVEITSEDGLVLRDWVMLVVHHGILGGAEAEDLANWIPCPGAPAEVEIRGKMITFENKRPDLEWVGVISPVLSVDLEREPVFTIDGVRANGPWFIEFYVQESDTNYRIKLPGDGAGPMQWSMQDVLGKKAGTRTFQIVLGIEQGDQHLSFFRDSMDLFYRLDDGGGRKQ